MPSLTTWSGSLHQSYRLLPTSEHLRAFLTSEDGSHWEDIHRKLPFDPNRSRSGKSQPDAKRYRDTKQLYETAGLIFQEDGIVWFTALGLALKRFLPFLNSNNAVLIARHAALLLAACQLRNPTDAGMKFDQSMTVFPFRFIWMAMLELDLRISSDELNRAIFHTKNVKELDASIDRIRSFRTSGDHAELGEETISGASKDDRIIPMISLASFGWALITDKKEGPIKGYYCIRRQYLRLIEAAVQTPMRHRDFPSVREYARNLSDAACLPKDLA